MIAFLGQPESSPPWGGVRSRHSQEVKYMELSAFCEGLGREEARLAAGANVCSQPLAALIRAVVFTPGGFLSPPQMALTIS